MTTIPAETGFVVVIPLFDNDGIAVLQSIRSPPGALRPTAADGYRSSTTVRSRRR